MPAKFVKADANSFADSGPSQLRFGDRGRSFTDKAPLKGTQHLLEGCDREFDSELGACIDGVLVLVGVLPFGGVSVGYLRLRAEVFDLTFGVFARRPRLGAPCANWIVALLTIMFSLR